MGTMTMKRFAISSMLICCGLTVPSLALELFEDFASPGKPKSGKNIKWSYTDQMRAVKGWQDIIPGDGFAYLTIDADRKNDKDRKKQKWPFQMISLSSIGPGHRLEMRAKNTVISGVASFIFTYTEADGMVDEIDIEIVGDDAQTPPENHPTGPAGGWTDARFNTWANADIKTLVPAISHKKPIVNEAGKKVSHQDDSFHIYTIEWRTDSVDFFIDGVRQQTITEVIPDSASTVLVGMRHMSWTGKLDWQGTRTMIVDWLRIEPVDGKNTQGGAEADVDKPRS